MSLSLQPIKGEVEQPLISHTCAGLRMTPAEFDAHENWEPGYRYELIQGVLVARPHPDLYPRSLYMQYVKAAQLELPPMKKRQILYDSAGIQLSTEEFDAHENWEPGYRYELIREVLVVNPPPPLSNQDTNDELGYFLESYRRNSIGQSSVDGTSRDYCVVFGDNRRVVDRAIWCGLNRFPERAEDLPNILVELVSPGRAQWLRDYEVKRDEYLALGVKEYWIFDRFARNMTIYRSAASGPVAQVIKETEVVRTELLPGFELPLAKLLACADRWPDQKP